MAAGSMVGTWRLVSFTMAGDDGRVTHPYGQDPTGYYFFAPDGHSAAVLGRRDRPPFAATDVSGGSPEEKTSAVEDFTAYAGSYEFLGDRLVIHVEVSLFPNWVGGDQVRGVELEGDRLVLSARTTRGGAPGMARLTWERVRAG